MKSSTKFSDSTPLTPPHLPRLWISLLMLGFCLKAAAQCSSPTVSASRTPLRFEQVTTTFNSIDVGSWASPAVADLDGNGLLDLLIGHFEGSIFHYEQASVNSLSFNLVSDAFNAINLPYSSPEITDLDGDQLLDLLVGKSNGTISHYEQSAANSLSFTLVTATFNSIDVGAKSDPTITDLDGDGLLDLVIGSSGGPIHHYEQNAANSTLFTLVTTAFNGVGDHGFEVRPDFADIDGDGLVDWALGVNDGDVFHYEQTTLNSQTFNIANPANLSDIDINYVPSPTFTDLDHDGLLDLVIGKLAGDIYYYEQLAGSFTKFGTWVGIPSSAQAIQVWGQCLNGDVTVTAPAHFEVSLNQNSGYSSSVTIPQSGGKAIATTVYVRYNPSIEGMHTGNLQVSAAGSNATIFALEGETLPCTPGNGIWYVDAAAAPGGLGTTWDCAYRNLQDAINAASSGQEVWVKAGTYKPTGYPSGCSGCSTTRDWSFLLKDGVAVYGGFDGTETAREQRNWTANVTTLSGDIGTVGFTSDNCYHIVISVNDGNTTVLDGFSVTGGNANGSNTTAIEALQMQRQSGAGMQTIYSSVGISNCHFFKNQANNSGAAMSNFRTSSSISNCLFTGNLAFSTGGAIYNNACDVVITNATFSGNYASVGGAIYNNNWQGAGIQINNCLIWNNLASNNNSSSAASISGDNTPVVFINYSLVQYQTPTGTGNMDGITDASNANYPNFVTPLNPATAPSAAGNFHLNACSPVIDQGDDTANAGTTDLGGLPREVDNIPGGSLIDLGAYEVPGNSTPVAICQNLTVQLDGVGHASLLASSLDNGSTGCTALSFSASQTDFTCSNFGSNIVTLTATESNGRSGSCTATVTVTDPILPSIVCPANIVRYSDANQCTAIVAYANPTFSDNCSNVTLTRTSGPASGSPFNGTTMVNWCATDASGNSSVCGFTVTVNDNRAPTITCPANQTKNVDAGQCTAVVIYPTPMFSDNCTGTTAAVYSGQASGSAFPKGANAIVWQATDGSGLTSRCTFTITVNDNQLPVITCPGNQTKSTDAGLCAAVTTYTTPTFTDNCAGGSVTIQSGLPSGGAFPKGINTIVWRATDAAGMTKTCSFRITVNDTQAPGIVCPANQSKTTDANLCSAAVTYNLATFTDNCSGGSVIKLSGLNSGTAFPKGTSQVVFKATDAAGNQSLCTMTVTVTDAQLPTVACPANIAVTGTITNGVCSATVTYTTPAASDNCALQSSFLWSGLASNSVFPAGVTTNVWKATDDTGLTATCAFTITVGCGTGQQTMNDELGTMNKGNAARSLSPASKTDLTTLSRPVSGSNLDLRIMPNPATTEVQITIEGLTENGGQLTVFDAQGRVVWQQLNILSPMAHINVSDLPSGLYQVRLQTENGIVTKGLVVSKW